MCLLERRLGFFEEIRLVVRLTKEKITDCRARVQFHGLLQGIQCPVQQFPRSLFIGLLKIGFFNVETAKIDKRPLGLHIQFGAALVLFFSIVVSLH